jgi:hypothetical protein
MAYVRTADSSLLMGLEIPQRTEDGIGYVKKREEKFPKRFDVVKRPININQGAGGCWLVEMRNGMNCHAKRGPGAKCIGIERITGVMGQDSRTEINNQESRVMLRV